MNDFKVGDRVEYVGNVSSVMLGKVGVVVEPPFANSGMVYFDHGGAESYGAYSQSLRHVTTAPDVITIDRADLPEVTDVGGSLHSGTSDYFTDPEFGAAKHRRLALQQLAVAEFLEAREKAAEEVATEKEASEKLNKRRDELAVEVAKRACYVNFHKFSYEDYAPGTQAAIDMIIELEADRV